MVDELDDFLLLLLRCDGKRAAIASYEEETGAGHAEATRAVEVLARKNGIGKTAQIAKPAGSILVAGLTLVALYLLLM